MAGEQKPFGWIALFRDGHTIDQSAAIEPSAFQHLVEYLYGTPENPKKHYLLWFKITNGDQSYVVSFDRDGDAYIDTPDGKCHMTEMKIRSAHLLYQRVKDVFAVGFGGVDTTGKIDGRCIIINPDGSYETMGELPINYAMIKIQDASASKLRNRSAV